MASRTHYPQKNKYKELNELFRFQLSVFLHLFLLYSQIVYGIFISVLNTSLACIIFMQPCVKAYVSHDYAKV